ncbi:hypothetical protein [Actinokineospora cianjurensis]|uniref:Uncharacterized protein n=1 Tax=Actinokineospora cianjurensis TaxID=585224 RepID=A0A421BBL4_9PSEU|nr:hypothetical protein [Actinokineospora cianjurensis]RLK61755.1 hypothetical protein CLV68_2296 [Actinokineospora cianjurensis]
MRGVLRARCPSRPTLDPARADGEYYLAHSQVFTMKIANGSISPTTGLGGQHTLGSVGRWTDGREQDIITKMVRARHGAR